MDIENLVTHARARFDHELSRRTLKEKYLAKMVFTYRGGMWRAGPELQILLKCCTESELVILDLYETPVRVSTNELLELSQVRWQEQMNSWLSEYEELSRNR